MNSSENINKCCIPGVRITFIMVLNSDLNFAFTPICFSSCTIRDYCSFHPIHHEDKEINFTLSTSITLQKKKSQSSLTVTNGVM